MPIVTGLQTVTDALLEIGFLQEGESPSPTTLSDCLRRLNYLISRWQIEGLTIPTLARVLFTLQAGKGGQANPYKIGLNSSDPGLIIPRPPRQVDVEGAGLIYSATANPVSGALEIDRGVMTDDGYEAERLKDLQNSLFTSVYYKPDFNNDTGSLFLWPVPTDLTNTGVLYIRSQISPFPTTDSPLGSTQVAVPTGADEALYLGLANRIQRPYGRQIDEDLKLEAALSFMRLQMSNMNLTDLPNEFAFLNTSPGRGQYNIETGE